jgi:ribonuclease P protein component
MLPHERRLTRDQEYRDVYDKGRASRCPALVCLALDRPGQATRAGVVASKKVGDAVRRNRAKRRVREALRLVWPELAPTGWHVVVVATAATVTLDFGRLVEQLRSSLAELGPLTSRQGNPSEPHMESHR